MRPPGRKRPFPGPMSLVGEGLTSATSNAGGGVDWPAAGNSGSRARIDSRIIYSTFTSAFEGSLDLGFIATMISSISPDPALLGKFYADEAGKVNCKVGKESRVVGV